MTVLYCKLLMLAQALVLTLPMGWCCAVERSGGEQQAQIRSCCQQPVQAEHVRHCCRPDKPQPEVECCCQRTTAIPAMSVDIDPPASGVVGTRPVANLVACAAGEESSAPVVWPATGTARQALLCVWRL